MKWNLALELIIKFISEDCLHRCLIWFIRKYTQQNKNIVNLIKIIMQYMHIKTDTPICDVKYVYYALQPEPVQK